MASSAESVGEFIGFRELCQVVIQGNFHCGIGAKTVRTSGDHSEFVVETLGRAGGYLAFGFEPVQNQRFMGS